MQANVDFYDDVIRKSDKLSERYMLVRHEDFSMDPINYTEKIYNFIDHNTTKELLNWISASTSTVNQNREGDTYGTRKNSKQVITAWREKITYDQAEAVQRICKPVMDKLKYRIFYTEKEYHNLNISSF